jgi:hypothetical protein
METATAVHVDLRLGARFGGNNPCPGALPRYANLGLDDLADVGDKVSKELLRLIVRADFLSDLE